MEVISKAPLLGELCGGHISETGNRESNTRSGDGLEPSLLFFAFFATGCVNNQDESVR